MREKFNRGDWLFLGVCALVLAVGLGVGITLFEDAFPEASIDFRYDRNSSANVAEKLLLDQKLLLTGYRHAAEFDHDNSAKIYLERELGLEKANELTRGGVRIWYWRHRWFRPLQIEEVRVDVAPTGEIVSYFHKIPEDRAAGALSAEQERVTAQAFLRGLGIAPEKLQFISRSEQTLPKRKDITYVWEARDLHPAGAAYRYHIILHGDRVGAFSQFLKVPDQWIRDYRKLRSKNTTAALVDEVFLFMTVIAALSIFIVRLRRGDVQIRFALGTGIIGALLVIVVSLNGFPSALANYDTSTSYPAFLAQQILFPILQGLAAGIFLAVIVGAGESLYRERLPGQLAMPRMFIGRALSSKRVFKSFILGYALFAAFLAYQVLFYLGASRLGAWAPAEIPYASILNSAFPWAAVLFMGFFPSVSEEFMSRAFSVPFFEKWLRSPFAAMVIAGFIWGFGHAAYPNQPFYIRGVEVGVAGVVMGLLLYRFGLLGLLVWHYTVDALYTSFLLFRSNNAYYIFSAGLASLIFLIPTLAAIVLYLRRGGFVPDEELSNAAIGTVAPPATIEEARAEEVTPAVAAPVTRRAMILLAITALAAMAAVMLAGPALEDVVNYRITKQQATELARRHLAQMKIADLPGRVLPLAVSGFRWWNPNSRREDGGNPGDYDEAALHYLLRNVPFSTILGIHRDQIEGATWMVRFFDPGEKEELFVEVDPRSSRVVGMHEYREEQAPGASLEQSAAEAIARGELSRYRLRASDFELKEALVFQQPRRRDWLFHYQEKRPLAAEAYRRASVRISGDRVAQFAKTVRIPERARREFEEEGILNTILVIGKILGAISLLGLVIFGCVMAARENRFAWKTATKVAILLAPLAIASVLLQRELFLAQYDTSTPWETFSVVLIVVTVFAVAFQTGAAWISVAILETTLPSARRLLSRAGARRYGTAGVIAAITVVALFVLFAAIQRNLPRWLPHFVPTDGLGVPEIVAIPLPAVSILWQAIVVTLSLSAAVAGFIAALGATPPNRRLLLHWIAIASLVLVSMDSSVRLRQLPVAFAIAATGVVLIYVSAKYVLRNNLLAYPLAFFSAAILTGATSLLHNDRPDLQANAIVLIGIGVAVLAWYGLIGSRVPRPESRVESQQPF